MLHISGTFLFFNLYNDEKKETFHGLNDDMSFENSKQLALYDVTST